MTNPRDESVRTAGDVTEGLPSVDQQRAELGETVEALAHRLDVPARVKSSSAQTAHSAQATVQGNQQVLILGAVAAAVGFGVVCFLRRRSRR